VDVLFEKGNVDGNVDDKMKNQITLFKGELRRFPGEALLWKTAASC
jgi:hypothetical protein